MKLTPLSPRVVAIYGCRVFELFQEGAAFLWNEPSRGRSYFPDAGVGVTRYATREEAIAREKRHRMDVGELHPITEDAALSESEGK